MNTETRVECERLEKEVAYGELITGEIENRMHEATFNNPNELPAIRAELVAASTSLERHRRELLERRASHD